MNLSGYWLQFSQDLWHVCDTPATVQITTWISKQLKLISLFSSAVGRRVWRAVQVTPMECSLDGDISPYLAQWQAEEFDEQYQWLPWSVV